MKYIASFLIILAFGTSYAQDGKFNLGARSAGLGGASLTIRDEYGLFNNIAGISGISNPTAFAGFQDRYGVSEFQVIGGGALYPFSFGTTGIGFYKFGDENFSQQKIHLAVGNKIQMVSLGLGIDLVQYDIATIGTQQVIAIQFGGIAEITPQLLFGAHIFNLNQAELDNETGDRVPTIMKGGLSYLPTDELMLNLEVEKDLDFDEVVKFGIEYEVIDRVFLRTGISTDPFINAFGVGFHPKSFKFDYAFSRDANLGNIHELSISFTKIK